jgi:acetyl esterase/lipase
VRVVEALKPIRGEWTFGRDNADPRETPPSSLVVLYFHGGGFALCSPGTHRSITAKLLSVFLKRHGSEYPDAALFSVDYRKAPNHPYPAQIDDCLAAYSWLRSLVPPPRVVFAGDSAGGALVIETMLRIPGCPCQGSLSLPPPAGGMLLSPWTDLSDTAGRSWLDNAKYDYLPAKSVALFALCYANGAPLNEISVNQRDLLCDGRQLPPLFVSCGDKEVFFDQIRRFVALATAAGVDVDFRVERGMVHVFAAFHKLVEKESSRRWFSDMSDFIERVLRTEDGGIV